MNLKQLMTHALRPLISISAVAFVTALVSFALSGCALIGERVIKEPKVAIQSVDVKDMTVTGATVVFGVQVANPNSFALKVDSVRYAVEVGGKPLTAGQLKDGAEVAGNGTALIPIAVPVRYADVFSSLLDFMGKGTSTFRVKGDASVGIISIPFDHSGELKLKN